MFVSISRDKVQAGDLGLGHLRGWLQKRDDIRSKAALAGEHLDLVGDYNAI